MLRQAIASACRLANQRLPLHIRWASSSHKHNEGMLQMLEQLMKQEQAHAGSPSREKTARAVEKAIRIVAALDHPLTTTTHVNDVKWLSKEVRDRMKAHVEGKEYNPGPQVSERLIRDLLKLPAVGRARAKRLYQLGCRSFKDLHQPHLFSLLSDVQQAYLLFREHIEKESTPEIAEAIQECVKCAINPAYETVMVGAYRRGQTSFSVTELLMFHPGHVHVPTPDKLSVTNLFNLSEPLRGSTAIPVQEITDVLLQRGLSATGLRSASHQWKGVVRIPKRDEQGRWEPQTARLAAVAERQGDFRRVDITVAPLKSRGAAMLTLTGDDAFLDDIRSKAEQDGLYFNEFGLWRFHAEGADPNDSKLSAAPSDRDLKTTPGHWELLPSETEEQVLDELNIAWVDPAKRNFAFLAEQRRPRYKRKF